MITTYETETVITYEPGKTIVVSGEQGPVSFALGTVTNIVDVAGNLSPPHCERVKESGFIIRDRLSIARLSV